MYYTVSSLITVYLSDNNMKLKELQDLLNTRGMRITHTSIAEYKNGQSVPTFEKLKEMLKILGLPYSDKEIREIIRDSREDRKMHSDEEGIWRTGVRIRMKDMYNMNLSEFTTQLTERVSSLKEIGIENTNQYITYLIKKDLHDNWGIGQED